MEITIIGLCVILYLWWAKKVEHWVNISALGFRINCPQLFMTSPKFYFITRYFLLVVVGVVPYVFDKYYGLILAFICWVVVRFLGRTSAFNEYRENLKEMAIDSSDIASEEEKSEYLKAANKTNAELAQIIKKNKL